MELLNSHPAVAAAIAAFGASFGPSLPAGVRDKFLAAQAGGPVDSAVNVGEALYANRDLITDSDAKSAAMTLAAQCAMWCANPANRFHGLDLPEGPNGIARGVGISWAMQRELGEPAPTGFAWPEAEEDPEARADWAVAEGE